MVGVSTADFLLLGSPSDSITEALMWPDKASFAVVGKAISSEVEDTQVNVSSIVFLFFIVYLTINKNYY